MDLITRRDIQELLRKAAPPCVSLFMPTQRGGGEADRIRFRNLLDEAERRLADHGMRPPEARDFLQTGRELLADSLFWSHQCDGLALFLAPSFLRLYRLPLALAEQFFAGRRPYVRPLLPFLAGDGRFFLLALSQQGIRLLQGTRYAISSIDLPGLPHGLAEALRTHDRDEPLTFHARPSGGAGRWGAIYHGQGAGIDDAKDQLLRYFQQVDHGLHAVLKDEQAPVVLAGVDYLLPIFRQASSYPHLVDNVIDGNPDRLSERELHERAWAIVQPDYERAQREARGLYDRLKDTGRASNDVGALVPAAFRGELETLFVSASGDVWGTYDSTTQQVEQHVQAEPGDEELVNFASAHALLHRGTVLAFPREAMPGKGLLAGICWLPLAKHGKRP